MADTPTPERIEAVRQASDWLSDLRDHEIAHIINAVLSSAPQEPVADDDALLTRLGAAITEHREHIARMEAEFGRATVTLDERCAGIVLNFGDVIDLYDRLQAQRKRHE